MQTENQSDSSHCSQNADAQKGRSPAEPVANHGSHRKAQHDGYGHAAVDDRERTASLLGRNKRACQSAGIRRVQACGKSEQDARAHHLGVVCRCPGCDISKREDDHGQNEQLASVEIARERGQHRRTQRKSQREGGDELPRLRHRDRKIRRYFRQ